MVAECYKKLVKLPKHNGKTSVVSAWSAADGAKVLRKVLPELSREEHQRLAHFYGVLAGQLGNEHARLLDVAAQGTWGRDFIVTDYQVSGIGSDQFAAVYAEPLSALVKLRSQYSAIANAHHQVAKTWRGKKVTK